MPTPAPDILRTQDFHYHLPDELIARQPAVVRDHSRLLELTTHGQVHRRFNELPSMLGADDLLIVNDTRVLKARLRGRKDSGGAAELLVERIETEHTALCQVRVSKPLQPGRIVRIGEEIELTVVERAGEFYRLRFPRPVVEVLEACGDVPLPPYIDRATQAADELRYQTVYGRVDGAVAAPTAGLHFTEALLADIRKLGCAVEAITLHVGAGTFLPVRAEQVDAHKMHAERYHIPQATASAVANARARGGRLIAVGTTVVRALESATTEAGLTTGWGETRLFITPGYRFNSVDALITNFHLPRSTLLMLVAAFGGLQAVLAAYQEALEQRYRFFSYGDAMFLERADGV